MFYSTVHYEPSLFAFSNSDSFFCSSSFFLRDKMSKKDINTFLHKYTVQLSAKWAETILIYCFQISTASLRLQVFINLCEYPVLQDSRPRLSNQASFWINIRSVIHNLFILKCFHSLIRSSYYISFHNSFWSS